MLGLRLAATDAVDRERTIEAAGAMDTSETLSGERNRSVADAATREGLVGNQEERCRTGDLHLAVVADAESVGEHAERPHSGLRGRGRGRGDFCADCGGAESRLGPGINGGRGKVALGSG